MSRGYQISNNLLGWNSNLAHFKLHIAGYDTCLHTYHRSTTLVPSYTLLLPAEPIAAEGAYLN